MLDGLFGFAQIAVVVFTMVILGALGITSRSGRLPALPPVLVLKRFRVNEKPIDGVFLDISGRPKGLVAWLLGVLRLDGETRLQLTATTLSIRRASLHGQNLTVVPLDRVGSTLCGFRKSFGYLAIGLYFVVSGSLSLFQGLVRGLRESPSPSPFFPRQEPTHALAEALAGAFVALVLAAVFIAAYYFKKEMVIAVGDNAATGRLGLTFKPSVLEGVSIDINRVTRATELLNRKVLEARLNPETAAATLEAPPAAPQKNDPRAAAPPVPRCAGCSTPLEPDSQFCPECGRPADA